MYSDIRQGKQETTDQLDHHIKILVEKCSYTTEDEKKQHQLELLFHATKHFEVKKWVRSQAAQMETVTFDKLLQHAKQNEATIKDFHQHKSNRGVAMATTIDEIRTFKHRKGQGQGPRVTRVRYVVSVERFTHLENAQHWAKNVTSVATKTISVHSVGLSSQEPGTGSSIAHPEDVRAEVSHIVPGLEASWWPKVRTA